MHQARTHAFTFTEIPIARFFFQKQQKKTLKRFSFTHLQSLAIVEISMHVTVRLKKKKKKNAACARFLVEERFISSMKYEQ